MTDPVDTDALRKTAYELDGSDFRVVREAGGVLDEAADEIDRLRSVIENAPHQIYTDDTACPAAYGEEDAVCTCWKSRA